MRVPTSTGWRGVLVRGVPATLAAVLVTTGLAIPVAAPEAPVLEAKIHALADAAVLSGSEVELDTDLPTQAVGVDWDGNHEGAVEVRAKDGDTWGPWVRLEGNPNEGPDVTSREYHPRTGAGPAWLGHGIGKVQARVVEGDLQGIRLHAIRSEEPAARRGIRPAGAVVAQPGIMSRAGWGADESFRNLNAGCAQPEYADSVRASFVHHTVNANNYAPADGPALVRAIYYFHTHTQKWCDVGYNFLIDRYGQAYEGRYGGITRPVIGAHAQGFNTGSTGVALIGTFQDESVPTAMYSSLRGVLAWKLAYHGVNPASTVALGGRAVPAVAGHRDVNATDCPGNLAYNLLPQLRPQLAGDLQGSIDKPAVRRANTFFLAKWQTTGRADATIGFGDAADAAIMGDWNGDRTRTPGVFRNGTWYLRDSNTTGVADVAFGYGDPGDRPVLGDWNGDGVDTPGVVRNGVWYLRNSNSTGVADVALGYGDPGDLVVAGDWNGDGADTPGIVRSGAWYLRDSNSTGRADVAFGFGNPTDRPVAGDWNGDGADTPGVLRNGAWFLRNSNTTGRADVAFGLGDTGDRPAAWS